jgi:hypothetical protein
MDGLYYLVRPYVFGLNMFEPFWKVIHPNTIPVEVGLTLELLWNPIAKKSFFRFKINL